MPRLTCASRLPCCIASPQEVLGLGATMRCRLLAPADAQLREFWEVLALDVPHAQVQLRLGEAHVLGSNVDDCTRDTAEVVGEGGRQVELRLQLMASR
eukprot:748005-Hanusia_phi.AAC.4